MSRHGFKSSRRLAAALLLCAAASTAAGQQRELPRISQPTRVITIQGQVSLPEGTPAGPAVVTLTSRAGVPRQTYTTDQGRFEFPDVPEGGYILSARSLTEPALATDRVETDTSFTATGSLTVNLIIRKDAAAASSGEPKKAEVLTAAEADQKVPKPARRAFKDALKLKDENQPEKALENFTRAVELYPDYFQALAERGDLLVAQRKLADASKDFERALKVNPRYAPALRGAGYCKLEGREFEEAAKYLEQSLSVQPTHPNAYLLLGIAYLELDRREQAKTALLKALAFNTQRELRAHIYLGNLYARSGQFHEAADELRKYLDANPTDPDAAELQEVEAKWRARAPAP